MWRQDSRNRSGAPSAEHGGEEQTQSGISPQMFARVVQRRRSQQQLERAAESEPQAPGEQLARATSGAPSELPHKKELERSFGEKLDGVQAYTGRGDELASLGARAAAGNGKVAFREAQPDRHTVAHEVSHVLQARRGGASSQEVSRPGDAGEHEAHRAADAAASGGRAEIRGAAPAQVSLILDEEVEKILDEFDADAKKRQSLKSTLRMGLQMKFKTKYENATADQVRQVFISTGVKHKGGLTKEEVKIPTDASTEVPVPEAHNDGDRYLDTLRKDSPARVNDARSMQGTEGRESREYGENCSLVAIAALLGISTSEVAQLLGQKPENQSAEVICGSKNEESVDGQIAGIKKLTQKLLSEHIKIDQGGEGTDRLTIEEGVKQMKLKVPGTQFICFVGKGSGLAHYVNAEVRGTSSGNVILFEDHQPQLAKPVSGPPREKDEIGPDKRPARIDAPPPTQFGQVKGKEFNQLVYLSFEPSQELIKEVLKVGHGGPHDQMRAEKHDGKKEDK